MKKVKDTHRPPHIYIDNTYYFITVSTLHKKPFFDTDQKKDFIKKALHAACHTYNYDLIAWVILDNHLHSLLKIGNSALLPQYIRSIQGKSAGELNKLLGAHGIRRWYQYWDTCIRDEEGLWKCVNYIHQNPVKHGYVKKMEDYIFSSYRRQLSLYGKEWLHSCFERYSIISFDIHDEF